MQGSRAQPYRVRIGIDRVRQAGVGHGWSARSPTAPGTRAKLLAGEMPEDIEDVFAALGLSLFPAAAGELSMDCSCPDWEVPCKHLAAAFYLLAEAFDDDPFAHPGLARPRAGGSAGQPARRPQRRSAGRTAPSRPGAPLADCLDSFFAMPAPLPVTPPATSSTSVLDQVPPLSLALRGHPIADLLRPAYDCFGAADLQPDP